MLREGTKWFLDNNFLVVVPSSLPHIWGDIGNRGEIIYDREILNESLSLLGYTEKDYYVYNHENREYNYLIYLLEGSENNPIYFSRENINLSGSLTEIELINFDISRWNVGDRVYIGNSGSDIEDIISANIEEIDLVERKIRFGGDIYSELLEFPGSRFKMVSRVGEIIGIIQLFNSDIGNIKNRTIKYGSKIFTNAVF